MYTRKTWKSKNAIEIAEYHDCRYGAPGRSRMEKRKATPEEMEKQNQRNRERKARHKLWANFKEDEKQTAGHGRSKADLQQSDRDHPEGI